jgi:hypothetical protein
MCYAKEGAPFLQLVPSDSEQELWEEKAGCSCRRRASREWQAPERRRSPLISGLALPPPRVARQSVSPQTRTTSSCREDGSESALGILS